MKRFLLLFVIAVLAGTSSSAQVPAGNPDARDVPASQARGGYVIERDADVQQAEPGTHGGGGQTVGYSFFAAVPNLKLVFRKRALKPGSGIGHHEQTEDEIYYVLSGRGIMTVDEDRFEVGPGTAVLTRPGSSHSLRQVGDEDLVILINYER